MAPNRTTTSIDDGENPRPKRSSRDDEDTVILKLPLILPDEEIDLSEVTEPAKPVKH